MAALDAGVPLRDVQIDARRADPRTTTVYDLRRQSFDRHAAYVVVALIAGADTGSRRTMVGVSEAADHQDRAPHGAALLRVT